MLGQGCSEVLVLVDGEVSILSSDELLVHGDDLALIDGNFSRLEDGGLNEGEVGVTIYKVINDSFELWRQPSHSPINAILLTRRVCGGAR